jgi:hypothetical protein
MGGVSVMLPTPIPINRLHFPTLESMDTKTRHIPRIAPTIRNRLLPLPMKSVCKLFLSFKVDTEESFTGYQLKPHQSTNHDTYGSIGKNYKN